MIRFENVKKHKHINNLQLQDESDNEEWSAAKVDWSGSPILVSSMEPQMQQFAFVSIVGFYSYWNVWVCTAVDRIGKDVTRGLVWNLEGKKLGVLGLA